MGVTLEAIGGHWETILIYCVKKLTISGIHAKKNLRISLTDENHKQPI